jgi:hypothetical protein
MKYINAQVLEAASAFMFFEQQLGELIEDFGMGKKGKKYFECNQEPGDLLFVPGSLVRVSLNLEDSISYFEHLHTSQQAAQEQIDSKLWAPASGRVPDGFNAAVCYAASVPTCLAAALTEICLRGVCSGREILRRDGRTAEIDRPPY